MKNLLTITPKDDSLTDFVATGAGDFYHAMSIKHLFGKSRFEIKDEVYKIKTSLLRKRRIELRLNKKLVAKAWRKNLISRHYEISFADSILEMKSETGPNKPSIITLGDEELGIIQLEEPDSKRVVAELSDLLDLRVRLFLITIYLLTTL